MFIFYNNHILTQQKNTRNNSIEIILFIQTLKDIELLSKRRCWVRYEL